MNHKKTLLISSICCMSLSMSASAKQLQKLDTLTVTAQKVEENIQEVPISVSVMDEYAIEDNNIRKLSDVSDYTPNFQKFAPTGAGIFTPSIRGITTDIYTLTSAIGTYVDNIPYGVMGNDVVLNNIERIEVLKGPQGTLYGKNAYGGVINIITKKPNNETQGSFKIDLGEDKKRDYSAYISGPIIPNKFYGGFSFKHHEKDGFIKNTYKNKMDNYEEDDAAKLYLRYTPTDNLELSLISSYLKKNNGAGSMTPASSSDVRTTASNRQGYTESKSNSHALKVEYSDNNINYSSVTTYKYYHDKRGSDFDYSPADRVFSAVNSKFDSYSEEFKIDGTHGKFKWLTGLYLDKNDELPFFQRNNRTTTHNKTQTKTIGIFANNDYSINDKLILTTGLRYDKDNIETTDYVSTQDYSKSYSEISPKIGIKYLKNDNFMSYASISKGYKAGGFYLFAPQGYPKEYDKETLWNYEIGLKSKSFNDKLLFNASIFYMDIENMQVSTNLSPLTAYISNAAKASSKGFEIESSYQATPELNLFANLGYTKAEFKNFKDSLGDYSGNYTPFAPKYNYSLGFKYRDEKGIFGQFDITGQDSYYSSKTNNTKSEKYALMNLKVGYETENYEIYLYSNNITDKKYDLEGYFDYYTVLSPPRETGISISYKF